MSLSRRSLLSTACTAALLVGAHTNAADPQAPNSNAARQNRPDPNAAAQRETRENPNRNQAEARANRPTGQAGQLDSELAACLIIGNQKEIAISRLAEKSQNEEVKKFAQQMVQDHEKFAGELQKFADEGGFQAQQLAVNSAAESGAQRPRTTTQPDRARGTEGTRAAARSEALDQQGGPHEMISIEREVAQQCVQTAQHEMNEKQGAEADQCYIGMQVGAHMMMADKLEVFARHASPELQAVLQQGLKTTQQHLEHAKKIHKSLEGQASAQPREKK